MSKKKIFFKKMKPNPFKAVTKSEEEALDLVQDTFLAADRWLKCLQDVRNFRKWITRIVFNLGCKKLRGNHEVFLGKEEQDEIFEALPERDEAPLAQCSEGTTKSRCPSGRRTGSNIYKTQQQYVQKPEVPLELVTQQCKYRVVRENGVWKMTDFADDVQVLSRLKQ